MVSTNTLKATKRSTALFFGRVNYHLVVDDDVRHGGCRCRNAVEPNAETRLSLGHVTLLVNFPPVCSKFGHVVVAEVADVVAAIFCTI